jgi:hypothetical protein
MKGVNFGIKYELGLIHADGLTERRGETHSRMFANTCCKGVKKKIQRQNWNYDKLHLLSGARGSVVV